MLPITILIIITGIGIWWAIEIKRPVDEEIEEGEKFKKEEIGTLTIEDIIN